MFSEDTPEGLMPVNSGVELLKRYAPQILDQYNPCVRELYRKDSTDMHFGDYLTVAEAIKQEIADGRHSVIVGQGTDSMTYANAFFSFRFPWKRFHLGVTGSMYPISHHGSDAHRNLTAALESGMEWDRWLGTYNYINNGEVLRASRSVKTQANKKVPQTDGEGLVVPEINAFQSYNYPLIGRLNGKNGAGRIYYTGRKNSKSLQEEFLNQQRRKIEYFKELEQIFGTPIFFGGDFYGQVGVVELHPNFDPGMLEDAARKKEYRAFVIKATGTGGLFNSPQNMALIPRIERIIKNGRFVVITSRVPRAIIETSYGVNRRGVQAGAVLAYDMNSEAVIAKTELASAIADTPEEFKHLMHYPFEDEIDPVLVPSEERVTDDLILAMLAEKGARKLKRKSA